MKDLRVTPQTKINRLPDRQVTDHAALHAILDEALLAHVAVVRDGLPVVLPMACARDGEFLLLHGSTGAGLLREGREARPLSVAVTHLDGLVVARSTFDHSMNYRSAVIMGVPEVLSGQAKAEALDRLVDHLLPGRSDEVRPSTKRELAATDILRLSLTEASVKVRAAPAGTDPDDGEDRTVWAGVLPLTTVASAPIPDDSVGGDVPVPDSVHVVSDRFRAS